MKFDYTCVDCGKTEERSVMLAEMEAQDCGCGAPMNRLFPATTANYRSGDFTTAFLPFESYYDESLDCDVNGRREKAQILQSEGLVEAGDAVGGARNLETNPHAEMVKPMAPTGRSYSDLQRERAAAETETGFEHVYSQKSDGTEKRVDVNSLPSL